MTTEIVENPLEDLGVVFVEEKKPRKKRTPQVQTSLPAQPEEPLMTSPEWSEWVMSHFTERELDPNGNPLVHGLRRVTRLLLGPILYSGVEPIQAPSFLPGYEKVGIMNPAVMGYKLTILMCRTENPSMPAYQVTYTDAADVYFGNTDPDYARHASATAATKAEARCYRKALQLRAVASEELTVVPTFNAAVDGLIVPEQVNFIAALCARNDINVMKFINSGRKKYAEISEVPYGTAAQMVEHLSNLQNRGNIPEDVRGYDKNWRN
jgi:hypothetical protein